MKDIKSLYHAARISSDDKDLNAYAEAIHDLLEHKPYEYLSNLEYIISSSVGLQTWNEFVDKYGIAIPTYDNIHEVFEACCEKCKNQKVKDSLEKHKKQLEDYKKSFKECFDMFSYYSDGNNDKYIKTYYGFNENGIQNKKLIKGMTSVFGEVAVPDILITSYQMGESATTQSMNFFESAFGTIDPIFNQWITEASEENDKNINYRAITKKLLSFEKEARKATREEIKRRLSTANKDGSNKLPSGFNVYFLMADDTNTFREKKNALLKGIDNKASIAKFIDSLKDEYKDGSIFSNKARIRIIVEFITKKELGKDSENATKEILFKSLPVALEKYLNDDIIKISLSNKDDITKTNDSFTDLRRVMKESYEEFVEDVALGYSFAMEVDVYLNLQYIFGDMKTNDSAKKFNENSISNLITDAIEMNNQFYRESAIMGDIDGFEYIFSESEINSIMDLIRYKEYKLTCCESSEEINKISKEIYSLYEYLDGYVDESGDIFTEATGKKVDNYQLKSKTAERELKILGKKANDVNYDIPKEVIVTLGDKNTTLDFTFKTVISTLYDKNGSKIKNASFREVPLACYYFNRVYEDGKICGVKGIKLSKYISEYINSMNKQGKLEQKLSKDLIENMKTFKFKAKRMFFKPDGCIGFEFESDIDPEHGFGLNVKFTNHTSPGNTKYKKGITNGDDEVAFESGDIATDITPMLVGSNIMREANFYLNTRNKKTGEIPGYLKNNHDLMYGEDEAKPKEDDDLEQYRRKSADSTDDSDTEDNTDNFDNDNDTDDDEDTSKEKKDRAVNNYYYYTYTNSMNKNSNSYNKDSSKHDDHSSIVNTSSRDSHNRDDHSTGKRINSDNHYSQESANDDDDEDNSPKSLNEAAGNDGKPTSDHPVKDTLQDIDRVSTKYQQKVKRGVQNVQNAGRALAKPFNRTKSWILNMVNNWKDKNENEIKEQMADPHARSTLYKAIRSAIKVGALYKAGLLLNPIFIFLTGANIINKKKNTQRLKNEMIGELKAEIQIIDEKIKDADGKDNGAKYKLMRLRNEMNKKLMRVGGYGTRNWTKQL